jgi:PHP family Zn ribbon phosphoesterase
MPAFFDATCAKCRRKFGWSGELKDQPPCPKCGHVNKINDQDRKALEEFEKLLEERMLKDVT